MRTYEEARTYSKQNPTQLVEFLYMYSTDSPMSTGFLLNDRLNGLGIRYYNLGSVECQCLYKNNVRHGECIYYNKEGVVIDNYFNIDGLRVEELDDLVNEPRDDAFYVTLALYGIDKEYTF